MKHSIALTILGYAYIVFTCNGLDANTVSLSISGLYFKILYIRKLTRRLGALGGYPGNPCERLGLSCDPIVPDFCEGEFDAKVDLPCGPKIWVGVGCCWHGPPRN